jgi:predicted nucleic acid-binding protein
VVILDASAAVYILLNLLPNRAARIRERLRGEQLNAPHLIDIEVAQAVRRLVRVGDVTEAAGAFALLNLANMAIDRYPHFPFLGSIWDMRNNRTAYDAAYVALAELLDVPLITADARMAATPAAVAIEVY